MIKTRKLGFLTSLFLLLVVPASHAAKDEIYTSFFSNTGVGGYDVVAYFTVGGPVKGNENIAAEHNGADWYFSSEENLKLFKENPEKYAPQYGGYCAWAVANGDTASGDPQQWTVYNNKLYMNYNAEIQAKWALDRDNFIEKANMNWPEVLK